MKIEHVLAALIVVCSTAIGLALTDPPLVVETKEDDYVVTDERVLDSLARIETYLNVLLDQEGDDSEKVAVNINTASYEELLTVSGIGPVKAGAIIAERGQHGLFLDWQDLQQRVSGVGPSTIADIQAEGATLE